MALALLVCWLGLTQTLGISSSAAQLGFPSSAAGIQADQIGTRPTFEDIRGRVTPNAVIGFARDFDAYYAASSNSIEGYSLEHLISQSEASPDGVQQLRKASRASQIDFELVNNNTREVTTAYQCKRTLTTDHIQDPKYVGQNFLTTRESRSFLASELAKRELDAVRRGVELDPQWRAVKHAFDEGRIPATLPITGEPLPGKALVATHAREQTERLWKKTLSEIEPDIVLKLPPSSQRISTRTPRAVSVAICPKITPLRTIAFGGAITALAETAIIWYGYESGEILEGDLPERFLLAGVHTAIVMGAEGALFLLCTNPGGWTVIAVGVATGVAIHVVDSAWVWWKDNFESKSVSMEDLAMILPTQLQPMLSAPSNMDRWIASRNGDAGAWEKSWRPPLEDVPTPLSTETNP